MECICAETKALVKISFSRIAWDNRWSHQRCQKRINEAGVVRLAAHVVRFDRRRSDGYDSAHRRKCMRQFVYGVILGAAALYCYVRLDPPKILDYLNAATRSAVESTHGYGGTRK